MPGTFPLRRASASGTGGSSLTCSHRNEIGREELLHIGDSEENDGRGANAAGVASVVVQDTEGRRRAARALLDRDCYRRDERWAGVVAAAYAAREPRPATAEERFGRVTLGPLFSACAHKVAEVCRDRGVRHVYFLAGRRCVVLEFVFEECGSRSGLRTPDHAQRTSLSHAPR